MPTLSYNRGTLLLDGADDAPSTFVRDDRVGLLRAPARCYRTAFAELHRRYKGELEDEARAYGPLELTLRSQRTPYPHQAEALDAWKAAKRRGLVVLPTGSGKTFVAELALRDTGRSALIVVPTIDLLNQWYSRLLAALQVDDVGLVGGGYYDIRDLTVTTYDSFAIHAERLGNRFALLIFDECHHLPSPGYSAAANCFIAPFRLGLTATPEREEGIEAAYGDHIGPVVYEKAIRDLAGSHLAEYETRQIAVDLTEDEREAYTENRERYISFLRSERVSMGSRNGWGHFIQLAARSRTGRRALLAYWTQRRIALTCRGKLEALELLLNRHTVDRTLVFTNDNLSAYQIAEWFLIPAITHKTPTKERKHILDGIRAGTYRAVVTSKVLNEGVDIPTANVAIVLSGSGSVREHVQRLGRILRRAKDKTAILYEVIARDTMEAWVSERRREHDAYR